MKLQIIAAVTVAALGLSACSTTDVPATGQHAGMNAGERCAMHREMVKGKSPAEQRAVAEAHITAMHGSADAAHIDRHLQMMERMCGSKPDAGTVSR